MENMKKIELVCIPSPGAGHMLPMVELARLIVARDQRISIAIFVIKRPGDLGTNRSTDCIDVDRTRIRFLHLPEPDSSSITHLHGLAHFLASNGEILNPVVKEAIVNNSELIGNLAGLLVDMFCVSMLDVARELRVPCYLYYLGGASSFALMNHMHAALSDESEFANSDSAMLDIPVFKHPYPTSVLPLVMTDKLFLGLTKKFNEAKGILVNTFVDLEPRAVGIVSHCGGNGRNLAFPPIYPVGPIIHHGKNTTMAAGELKSEEIIRWLDGQPRSTVVFLCFGSTGIYDKLQVKEIAVALERSGHRFLWSLRSPTNGEEYENPGEGALPEGFLERTAGVGKLIGWAPQVEILSHKAVGGFVSHCGWNSILEGLWHGVPIATWPLFAEQQMNAFLLVKELELAVEVKMDSNKKSHELKDREIVLASVIESAIRRLMDNESNIEKIRKNVNDISEKSRKTLIEGGPSYISLGRFIEDVIHNAP